MRVRAEQLETLRRIIHDGRHEAEPEYVEAIKAWKRLAVESFHPAEEPSSGPVLDQFFAPCRSARAGRQALVFPCNGIIDSTIGT